MDEYFDTELAEIRLLKTGSNDSYHLTFCLTAKADFKLKTDGCAQSSVFISVML